MVTFYVNTVQGSKPGYQLEGCYPIDTSSYLAVFSLMAYPGNDVSSYKF